MTEITAFDTTGEGRTAAQIRSLIPRKPAAVFGYIDNVSAWPAEAWSIFGPGVRKKRISTLANPLADVFDYENGTASLEQIAHAVELRGAVYLGSVVYVSASRWAEAKAALPGSVAWFIAAWGGPPPKHPMAGAAGWQWFNGPDYDESVIDTEAWPEW